MERKPQSQPDPVTANRPATLATVLLCFLMLWPWLVVGYGLHIVRDYRATILAYELLCCLLPLVLLRAVFPNTPIRLLPLHLPPWRLLALCLSAAGVILGLFTLFGRQALSLSDFQAHTAAIGLRVDSVFWMLGWWLVVLNPLLEEAFWRGLVYRQWKRILPVWQANLLSSFFFGAWHWVILQLVCPPIWALLLAAVVMAGGVAFAWLYEKTGTLGAPVLIHGLGADLPLLLIVYWSLTGTVGG